MFFLSVGFDSKNQKFHASIAQLVEQLICNQLVGGSSPSTGSLADFGCGISVFGFVEQQPKSQIRNRRGCAEVGETGQTVNLLLDS